MDKSLPTLIVVTGPPAAGKTWLATNLREELRLPLIAKDTLKETLGDALDVTERGESQRLGGAVYELIGSIVRELLETGMSVIVEGNFTSKTRLFHALPGVRIVQIHVGAQPDVLRMRMAERGTGRHPVHYDSDAVDEICARAAAGEWDALPLEGKLIAIDTTDDFDVDLCALVQRIRSA